jgi:hypothetical protein
MGAFDGKFSAAAVINHVRKGFAEDGVIPGGLLDVEGSAGDPTPTPTPDQPDEEPNDPTPTNDTTAPSTPTVLRATGASSSTNGLTWVASSDNVGVAGYEIYRDGVKIATATGTTYTDAGLNSGTAYVYKVKAFDAAGNTSAASNNDTGTTFAAGAAPAAPTSLTASKLSSRRVKLTLTDRASNESGFYVWTSTNGTTWTKLATVGAKSGTGSSLSYTSGSFSAGTRYFRVTAFNGAGESSPTSSVKVTL